MDYFEAKWQRSELDAAIRRLPGSNPAFVLPPCNEGNECMDGRCPICSSRLCAHIEDIVRDLWAMGRIWRFASFVVDPEISERGSSKQVNFDKIKAGLFKLSSFFFWSGSVFIGSFGMLTRWQGQPGNKLAAIKIFYSGREEDAVEKCADILADQYGSDFQELREDLFGDEFECQFLSGYHYHDANGDMDPIFSHALLSELSQNYGPHRVLDRIVTHGLAIENGRIVPSAGASGPLLLKSFSGRPSSQACEREQRQW
ncbi:hypothetical protein ELH39_00960 [Rhizobium ruizarguesonis]|uniref:hypothetical protein n=1 Tax=Rhizobium ruizarguesonis TaxID=2081791 RepID=UPI0010308FDF|nr:hypothetical protein [Rhizobium ruizarguesonis]TBB95922.1 hypothetical protein ELH39_00960 [Rhizobium ruizarguesonis]